MFENTFEHSVRLCLQVQVAQQEAARGGYLGAGQWRRAENKLMFFKQGAGAFTVFWSASECGRH